METIKARKKRLRAIGKLGGLVGGPARAAALTPERRQVIARAAAIARWGINEPKAAPKNS